MSYETHNSSLADFSFSGTALFLLLLSPDDFLVYICSTGCCLEEGVKLGSPSGSLYCGDICMREAHT